MQHCFDFADFKNKRLGTLTGTTAGAGKMLAKNVTPWPPAVGNDFSCVQRANLAPAGIWEMHRTGTDETDRKSQPVVPTCPTGTWSSGNAVAVAVPWDGEKYHPRKTGRQKVAPQVGTDKGPSLDSERP